MFKLNTQTLANTGEKLEEQCRSYQRIRDEMDDCLSKLRSMSDLSHETKKLKEVINKADTEIYLMSALSASFKWKVPSGPNLNSTCALTDRTADRHITAINKIFFMSFVFIDYVSTFIQLYSFCASDRTRTCTS